MLSFDWSSLLIFGGIINAIISITFLVINRNQYKRTFLFWIILFLVFVALILFERIIRFSSLETSYPELLFITSPLFFFILPLLYIFQCNLNGRQVKWYYHFIIPVLLFLLLLPTITMDNNEKLVMYNKQDINDPIWIVLFYFLFAVYYSVKTFILNKKHKVSLLNTNSSNEIELQLLSNRLVYYSSILITVIPISLSIQYIGIQTEAIDKTLFVLFSLVPHLILISILTLGTFNDTNELVVEEKKPNDINSQNLEDLKSELTAFMVENQPYLNKDLNLQALANSMDWSRSNLSMVINRGFNKNFYDYINGYRLQLVIEKLKDGLHNSYSLDYIVSESGFKNYVSFFRIFKRVKNKSPKDYIEYLKTQ